MSSDKMNDDNVNETEYEGTPYDTLVFDKYKHAASVANGVIKILAERCVVGASVRDLCQQGDKEIVNQCQSIYKKDKTMKKGVAFPTCISVNNCLCHFSPLSTDPDVFLKKSDLVKIDLSVHVDGCSASVATTVIVGASKESPIVGRQADVLMAAYNALQVATRMLVVGNSNHSVTDAVKEISQDYLCTPVEGMISHEIRKDDLFSNKLIMFNPNESSRKEYKVSTFEPYEVYSLDIFVSTSAEGRCIEKDTSSTIFRRNQDVTYNLRSSTARENLNFINTNFPRMAFHLREMPNLNKARLAFKECVPHQLITSYPVFYDREKELISQMKATIIVTPAGPLVLTNPLFDLEMVICDKKLQNEKYQKLLSTPLSVKKVKRTQKQSDSKKKDESH